MEVSMKSLFSVMTICSFLALSITACSSDSKKATAPKDTTAVASATKDSAMPTPITKVDKEIKKTTKSETIKKDKVAVTTTTAGVVMTCVNGSDSRSIELKNVGTGCELMYTKHGEAKSIATAKNGSEYCEKISQKLVKNLNAAGIICK